MRREGAAERRAEESDGATRHAACLATRAPRARADAPALRGLAATLLPGAAWLGAVLALGVGGLSCAGRPADAESAGPSIIADAPAPYSPPSLSASIPVATPSFALGGASFDLSAHPEKHEFRVHLVLGAPVPASRWDACREVVLDIDGERSRLGARPTGVSMPQGFYDALSVELNIEHVRAMSEAGEVEAHVCGDTVILSAQHLPSLRDFVHRFEEMATYDGPPPPSPPRAFDPADPEGADEPPTYPFPA